MRRMFTPLLLILTALALALPAGSTRAAERGVTFSALLSTTEDWIAKGETDGEGFGISVASAGDVNGDGISDVIIGAQKRVIPPSTEKVGAAFIYLGATGGGLDNAYAAILSMHEFGSLFGAAVSDAGDVNGDGYDDVIVGAPDHKEDGINGKPGAAYVYHGPLYGSLNLPNWSNAGSVKDMHLGAAVAGAGDVNGDGYDDVLVGAPLYTGGFDLEGIVYLFLGSVNGLSAEPAWIATGQQAGAQLGAAVAGVGDLNKDGYDDFAASAPLFNGDAGIDTGTVYIWYGSETAPGSVLAWSAVGSSAEEILGSSISGAGDIDANNYVDIIIGAKGYTNIDNTTVGAAYLYTNTGGILGTTPSWSSFGPAAYPSGYGISVAGVGDLNNDGFADVAVGAPTCDKTKQGCVYVYRGSITGLPTRETWLGLGGKAETEFGRAVGGAGDINGDGYDDLIVGAPIFKWDDKTPTGKASVYYGAEYVEIPTYWFYLPVVTK